MKPQTNGTHTCPNQCMKREMSQCCGIKQYTDREVTANRPDIIIKNTKEKTCTLIDVAIPADRNVVQKEAEKKLEIQEFMYRDRANLEPETYDHTRNYWSHWNSNEKLMEKFGSCTRKTLQKTAIL